MLKSNVTWTWTRRLQNYKTHGIRYDPATSSTLSACSSRSPRMIFSLLPWKTATVEVALSRNSVVGPSPGSIRAADRRSAIADCTPAKFHHPAEVASDLCKQDCCCCCCYSYESIRSPPFLRFRYRHPRQSHPMSTRLRRCFLGRTNVPKCELVNFKQVLEE